ncbi:Transcriptional regulator PadR-like family protein [Natronoarchaeum philippinense]|uniref:Transcriptional regulator PadR-like family protein n=1 Tax=Natronoarchaeum philippinense TaxID=558529 RepID=A0A285N9D0_NATPI|nr:Transcriptional regulator PadR-like family protein [Natronoarchaeum philippinense]
MTDDTTADRPSTDSDRAAFLEGDAHYCDLCSTPFETLGELADHDCSPTVAPDGGIIKITRTDLTGFQRDLLEAIASVEQSQDEPPYGLEIKNHIEDEYGEEIHHGRLYPNLDELVEIGLVEKGMLDQRTNSYELTARGRKVLRDLAAALNEVLEA